MLASGPVRVLAVMCNRPVNLTELMGYGASRVMRIDITSRPRLIIGEVTLAPQALKGPTISFAVTNSQY